jgi:hypothetical protein
MDSIDRDILKYMSKRDTYNELKDTITKTLCVKESWEMLADFGEYFEQHPLVGEIDGDFKMWQRVVRHPNWKPEEARIKGSIVDSVLGASPPVRSTFLDNIYHLRTTEAYNKIAKGLADGSISADDAETKVRGLTRAAPVNNTVTSFSIADLAVAQRKGGFYWRLEDLNQSLGPIRQGDVTIIAKRPEVGGTSFLVSEMSFMMEQTNGNAIIFNNEEAPDKVYSRMVSAALNVDYRKLLGDPAKFDTHYKKWLKGSSWDLVHDTSMTVGSIYKQLEDKKYDLIGINVLLKVGGTGKTEDHDKFQELGEECRRIAQKYGPVLAIVQADPSAEGMQYIPQDRIYKSKTALQGEADALIMIGTDDEIVDDTRYIHVAKNKFPPAACTNTKCKHIKSQVAFDMDTGRFSTRNFKGVHSRGKS